MKIQICQCRLAPYCGEMGEVLCSLCGKWYCDDCYRMPDHHPCKDDPLERIPVLDSEPVIREKETV